MFMTAVEHIPDVATIPAPAYAVPNVNYLFALFVVSAPSRYRRRWG